MRPARRQINEITLYNYQLEFDLGRRSVSAEMKMLQNNYILKFVCGTRTCYLQFQYIETVMVGKF
jgi:hypothetical protein